MKMRTSTRPSFFALVISVWIISCAIVFVSVLVAPPASGQQARTGWSPSGAQPLESDGEVVFTFTKTEPGRITYRTMDGDCSTHPPWVPEPGQDPPQTRDCGRPRAQAPKDYGHVGGEMIFAEAGSKKIRIPIVDDDLDEVDEPFVVRAAEGDGVHEQMWLYTAGVLIIDDDPNTSSGSSSSSGQSRLQPGTQSGSPTRPASPLVTSSSSSEPRDAGNQSGVVNPGGPILEVEGSVADDAEPIAADTVGEDNFIFMAGLRALALVTIAAAGFALKKRFGRRST